MKDIPTIAVIILTLNQKDYTLACLTSLAQITYSNIAVVVVDNNSQDDTVKAINETFPEVHLVRSTRNCGVAGGRNLGIKYAEKTFPYDYLLILDNDTTVDKDFLQPMVDILENDPNIGVAAPKIYLMNEGKILDQAGGSVVNFYTGSTAKRGFGKEDIGQYDTRQTQTCLPSGACSLSRREVLCKCKGLDEIFNPYGFEDLDYSLRVKKAGYKVAYVPESIIYHKGNKTGFKSYSEEYASIKGKHLKTFMSRHASPLQRTCFTLLLPLLGVRTLVRETKRGNIKAVFRLLQSYIGKNK